MNRDAEKPVVALYLRYYLSPSETFVYRQLKGISEKFRPIVLAAYVHNLDLFPTESVFALGKNFTARVCAKLLQVMTRGYSTVTSAQRNYWKRVLVENGVRLVHAHFGLFGLDVLPVARSLGIPLAVTFHGFDGSRLLRNRRYADDLHSLFDYAHVVTVSKNMAERLNRFGLKDGGYTVHYIGVPVDEFAFIERPAIAAKLGRGEPLTFLQVSNFVEKKGHAYTIDAFSKYFRTRPMDRLILAGDGPLKRNMEILCAAKGIRENVAFPGRVFKTRIAELMREADVFVHHSVTAHDGDMEGIPTVIMEAMSTGLVVVSTKHSGIPELVEDGVDGFLVDERDVDAYADRLRALSGADPAMGKRARRKIEDKFNMATQNAELGKIYGRLINGGRI